MTVKELKMLLEGADEDMDVRFASQPNEFSIADAVEVTFGDDYAEDDYDAAAATRSRLYQVPKDERDDAWEDARHAADFDLHEAEKRVDALTRVLYLVDGKQTAALPGKVAERIDRA